MKNLLERYLPLFDTPDGGGGNGNGDTWAPPQGMPSEFAGTSADETLGKLLTGYNDLNTRFGGMREKLARMPAALEKPDLYSFDPGDNLKPFFGDLANNPAFGHARTAAHKYGLSQEQFSGFIADTYGPMAEAGLLPAPFDPAGELKGFQTATGLDNKATHEALTANMTFAKGIFGQLKGIPDAMKADVEAAFLGMTDTAAGNVLLRALSSRLADSGIRISGDGGGVGELTTEDLKKLDVDPRIDPRNRDHKDPNVRYDESLRKRYDEAYARHHGRR